MIVALQATPEFAGELLSLSPQSELSRKMIALLKKHHTALHPTFPQLNDPELRTHFFAEVKDPVAADKLAKSLMALSGVASAYLKPRDEAPSSVQ